MSSAAPRLSIVVPVRDDRRVDDLLESLGAQRGAPHFEVIVALDGSTRSPRWPPGLDGRVLPGPGAGPYAARNRGIGAARGDVLLLTDSDCLCPPGWVRIAAAAFEDPTLLALQGASKAAEDTRLSRWIQREYDRYVASHAAAGYRRFCNTRNFGLRRSLAFRSPFPESFPRGGDGVYGLTLERAGVKIRYAPEWEVFHRHPHSRWEEGRAAFEQGRQGALWQTEGLDLFGESEGLPRHGPGAWLARAAPGRPLAREATVGALLAAAGGLGAASAVIPGEIGYRAFSRFHRAAHLAGRLWGAGRRPGGFAR